MCVCVCAVIGFDLLSVYFSHSADHMNRFIVHTEKPLCCVVIRSFSLYVALSLLDSLSSGDDEDYDEDEDDAGNGNGVFHTLLFLISILFFD